MKTSSEIRSTLNNIKFYATEVEKLAKRQFDIDYETGEVLGINIEPGSMRFESLGAIMSASKWIEVYCENIESNLKYAEKFDGKLNVPEEVR